MLVSGDAQKVLAKYFVCCTGCGLPCVDKAEVCPMCGSTSWGWRNRGLKAVASTVVTSFVTGGILAYMLNYVLNPTVFLVVSLVMGSGMIIAPIQHVVVRKEVEERDRTKQMLVFSVPFLLFLAIVLWSFPVFRNFPFMASFCTIWALLSLDNKMFATRRGPSIERVSDLVSGKRRQLDQSLKRVSEEIAKIGTGRNLEVLAGLKEKLEKGKEVIASEIPALDRQFEFCKTLRTYFFWRYCLLATYNGIQRIRLCDIDAFEGINKELRYAIMELRITLNKARERGETEGIEIAEYIERSLGIHESVRDALSTRRANQILAGVDDIPADASPMGQASKEFSDADFTDKILDRMNVLYMRVKSENELTPRRDLPK